MGIDGPVPTAVRLQDDSCWQTQHRIPPEVQPPQIGKISIPEFADQHEVHRTVIVNKPQSYQKVKWNEFPEEVTPEIGVAPKVATQEWKPVNQENIELQRSLYRPGKIAKAWPPPQEEIVKEAQPVRIVKAGDDQGWIQQDPNDVIRSAAWQRNTKIDRVWPPPEGEHALSGYQGPKHMPSVQWPPVESEQHEREQVEVLQKHIPTKKMEYQWPPPPPVNQADSESDEFPLRVTPQAMTTKR
ncbi:hypothetical protein ANCCEY_08953 [Ancylostoma ceylanicum]|uniref:Uncharacterized protein n=1 Tax=Ancylostoma ceylanicum TaxID=53326 RepID=A0A0D6LIY5_9BILA|nr:hypothetical protein ANCCEY_08953 [Ancylostoma ceylanicum]